MIPRISHDLRKLIVPVAIILFIGTWQANYAMIYPLKALIASIAAYFLVTAGFLQRYLVLTARNSGEASEQWKTGSRLVLTGLAFYTLHPVAIALVLIGGFIYSFPPFPPVMISKKARQYDSIAWISSAILFVLMDILREFTVWKHPVLNPIPISILALVIVFSLINARPSKDAK